MADQDATSSQPQTEPYANGADTAPAVGLISQYIKDLSFENPNAPAIFQTQNAPSIDVQFNIGAQQVADEVHEVVLKIDIRAEIAGGHHERWDGTGYPRGIAGLAIPLAARIVAVADVFDALTTVRPYKDAMPPEEALRLIEDEAGQHFDPACVAAFVSRWDEILDICATSARSQGFRGEPRSHDRDMPTAVAAQ